MEWRVLHFERQGVDSSVNQNLSPRRSPSADAPAQCRPALKCVVAAVLSFGVGPGRRAPSNTAGVAAQILDAFSSARSRLLPLPFSPPVWGKWRGRKLPEETRQLFERRLKGKRSPKKIAVPPPLLPSLGDNCLGRHSERVIIMMISGVLRPEVTISSFDAAVQGSGNFDHTVFFNVD
ncbi:hypothetical protein HPB51_004618 [Rhipicephalus microplus]|uniref:Uncharacterized protein n=1 Tax=Rhipicephalus microplus TaxID=6941 RepID=A0A9J6ELR1_RHIMP|nr:hypothetical protein HPB51_004618 [Rhipicephalus microplus]